LELKMFDIGWSELVVIGVVALIAIGPKELPGALRTFGQWMGKVRRMAAEFQGQFQEAMREAEMAELKKQVDTLTSSFDPIETARKEIEGAMEEKPASAADPATGDVATSSSPADISGYMPTETPSASEAPPVVADKPAESASPSDTLTPQPAGGRVA
jgi:sec-independent protein translocase protein TatB